MPLHFDIVCHSCHSVDFGGFSSIYLFHPFSMFFHSVADAAPTGEQTVGWLADVDVQGGEFKKGCILGQI